MTRLEKDLIALATFSPAHMIERWAALEDGVAPSVPPALLRRLLAQRLQEKRYGKLPLLVARELERIFSPGPRAPEPVRPERLSASPIRTEIIEGLQLVRRHRVLFPIAARSIIAHVAGSFYGVLYTIFLIQELHLNPFLLGLVVSAGEGVAEISLIQGLSPDRILGRVSATLLLWSPLPRIRTAADYLSSDA